jgi:hypothetical protein
LELRRQLVLVRRRRRTRPHRQLEQPQELEETQVRLTLPQHPAHSLNGCSDPDAKGSGTGTVWPRTQTAIHTKSLLCDTKSEKLCRIWRHRMMIN